MTEYDENFYEINEKETESSAGAIMPFLLGRYQPDSVLDVGCARGLWLRECIRAGVKTVAGVDGPWVDTSELLIPKESFSQCDFEEGLKAGTMPKLKHFDLALCLEVAEHLTEEAGNYLVEWLCSTARVIAFSAAVPLQGGVNHINEQWPSYWHARFGRFGREPDGIPRLALWNKKTIQPYYRQNLMVYEPNVVPSIFVQDMIHPDMWTYKVNSLTVRT